MAKFRDDLPHPTDVTTGNHIHLHATRPRDGKSRIGTAIHQSIVDNLTGEWQNIERKFLSNLRVEMKAQRRRTHRTSAATRTMSKRKRAGSKRWPSHVTNVSDFITEVHNPTAPDHLARTVDIRHGFPLAPGQATPLPYRS
jgi:hypothetical protein